MELTLRQKAELVKRMGELMGYSDVMRIASALWMMSLEENGHDKHNAFVPSYDRWIGNSHYYKEAGAVTEEMDTMVRKLKGIGVDV